MAENETLDLGSRRNRRWRHFCDLIATGASPTQAAQAAGDCLLQVMKTIIRRDPVIGGPQFPLGELLEALPGPRQKLDAVLAKCDGHQYAHLLAEEHGSPNAEAALTRHLHRVTDRFLDQVGMELVGTEALPTFGRFGAYREDLHRVLSPRVTDLARRIAADPNRPPRAECRSAEERKESRSALLRESLLGRGGVRR